MIDDSIQDLYYYNFHPESLALQGLTCFIQSIENRLMLMIILNI